MNRYYEPNCNYPINFELLKDVTIDNVCERLNEACDGEFSYDVEIENGYHMAKVILKTRIKEVVGFCNVNCVDGKYCVNDEEIRKGLVQACRLGFIYTVSNFYETEKDPVHTDTGITEIKNEKENGEEAITTLDDVENELGIKVGEPIPFDPVKPQQGNDFGIRPDQIEFMKKFQEALKVDTTEKFNEYVKAWSLTESAFAVSTKRELISCAGPVGVDHFIQWVKEVYKDNLANNEFVCPTDSQLEEICK